MKYTNHYKLNNIPQTEPLNERQSRNNAGGYSFVISKWSRLTRFLILGTEGGTYYQGEKTLTIENAKNLVACIQEDGARVVNEILDVSINGRAYKNDPALFALAVACAKGNEEAKKLAHGAVVKVCRTGTHLFTFCEYLKNLTGWGRSLKRNVAAFYTSRSDKDLFYQLIKYRQRNGWSHRDVIKLSHPALTGSKKELAKFALGKDLKINDFSHEGIKTFLTLNSLEGKEQEALALKAIAELDFPWEALPTELLKNATIWKALLPDMGLIALVRNLGKLSSLEILTEFSQEEKLVLKKLTSEVEIKKSRIHPMQVLLGMKTYAQGRGVKGSMSWNVNSRITEALDELFEKSFTNVEATGQDLFLALDVSGSMDDKIMNTSLSCREAAAAMAMIFSRSEKNVIIKGFCRELKDLGITRKDTILAAAKKAYDSAFGSTNCSAPIEYAIKHNIKVDCFMVFTDNETYDGDIHPSEALKKYRKQVNPKAKMIVFGMTATDFSIADPEDKGMLDVVGFDASVPNLVKAFLKGEV